MIHDYLLDNGLRVILSEDRRTPVVAVCVWYSVGCRDEEPGRTGLAHLCEHLMFQGSANVARNEHVERIHLMGGFANGTTHFEHSLYLDVLPAEHLDLALDLEADRMATIAGSLTEEKVATQRDVVANEWRERYGGHGDGARWRELMARAHPEGHPYAHVPSGEIRDLPALSLENCRDFFLTHYTPDRAMLSIAGGFSPDKAAESVERRFAALPSGGRRGGRARFPSPVARNGRGQPALRRADAHVLWGSVLSAFRLAAPGRDFLAHELALTALGKGPVSRLWRRLIQETPVASHVSIGCSRLIHAPSVVWLELKAAPHVSMTALEDAVATELLRFAGEGPDDEELEYARTHLVRGWMEKLSSVEGRAEELCRRAALDDRPESVDQAEELIRHVSSEAVREAAAEFHPDHRTSIVHEPAAPTSCGGPS
ncbi:insulinase family protein [Nonomuraea mesophila]|uniref:Insulinase family protein n=1 Tax=Nonomuraea mesophila TaxID=2530382 RepID=A0A4R5FTZ7_9ACTN|nr:pitrilysin family protein [Nonomuraea mesophila]TDE57394.1 insulinase family protein [Nonomuraea mesophila]